MTIERIVTPEGELPADRTVRVALVVTFGPRATAACYEVNDRLPSGLAPLVASRRDEGGSGEAAIAPYLVEGQRVSWCIAPGRTTREFRLGYRARVVSPGTYRWEPATVRSSVGGDRVTMTPTRTIVID